MPRRSTGRHAGDEELVFALNHCHAILLDQAEDVNVEIPAVLVEQHWDWRMAMAERLGNADEGARFRDMAH